MNHNDPTLLMRTQHSSMEYYRDVYAHSKFWNGEDLTGKTLIVYCEQGFGDTIQFSRYFPQIGPVDDELNRQCKIYIHCPKELHMLYQRCELFRDMTFLDKLDRNLPPHDYHILSMSLPFVIEQPEALGPAHSFVPYILPDWPMQRLTKVDNTKVGICWEGNPNHPTAMYRNVALRHFQRLTDLGAEVYCLQPQMHNRQLLALCDNFDLLGVELPDWYETARLINEMHYVVSVDTGVLHLAGAMGKHCYGLISSDASDGRFDAVLPIESKYANKVSRWYPNMRILKKESQSGWTDMFDLLLADLY